MSVIGCISLSLVLGISFQSTTPLRMSSKYQMVRNIDRYYESQGGGSMNCCVDQGIGGVCWCLRIYKSASERDERGKMTWSNDWPPSNRSRVSLQATGQLCQLGSLLATAFEAEFKRMSQGSPHNALPDLLEPSGGRRLSSRSAW